MLPCMGEETGPAGGEVVRARFGSLSRGIGAASPGGQGVPPEGYAGKSSLLILLRVSVASVGESRVQMRVV